MAICGKGLEAGIRAREIEAEFKAGGKVREYKKKPAQKASPTLSELAQAYLEAKNDP